MNDWIGPRLYFALFCSRGFCATLFLAPFSCRRGFVVSVVKDLGIPVKLVGVGEKIDDLRDFQPEVCVS